MNQYPLWKKLLVLVVVTIGFLYAMPNLYGDDPAVQISPSGGGELSLAVRDDVHALLQRDKLTPKAEEFTPSGLLIRFDSTDTQLRAYEAVQNALGSSHTVALNLAPATPDWMAALGAEPMYLGLDLRGGVHFLLDVDMKAAVEQGLERYVSDLRTLLRDEKIRYLTVTNERGRVQIRFRDAEAAEKADDLIRRTYRELSLTSSAQDGTPVLYATITEAKLREIQQFAVQQNITTLRNRVDELGVAEPVIQRAGESRIVVQLPGVQDTARAKDILGATATLEYRLVDEQADVSAALAGRVPPGSRLYRSRDGEPVVLKRDIIITGDQVVDAASGFDPQTGGPLVSVTLDGQGARRMSDVTRENIGRRMAVVFIETKTEVRTVGGVQQRTARKTEEVISVAVIRDHFSKRFQTTGLDSPQEARDLALLLRAGALAAPMQIVEERTVGPSLGQENISRGINANVYGFTAVALFMIVYYRLFGAFSVTALAINGILLIAVLSILQATMTLPGMAAVALTIGMAIDANVLINERIREELRSGMSPRAAIDAGYKRAFGTILDSNITTFIAGFALFWLGSGPVRGFAVVLCLGIMTSVFSAIMVSRLLANFFYGRKARVTHVSI